MRTKRTMAILVAGFLLAAVSGPAIAAPTGDDPLDLGVLEGLFDWVGALFSSDSVPSSAAHADRDQPLAGASGSDESPGTEGGGFADPGGSLLETSTDQAGVVFDPGG